MAFKPSPCLSLAVLLLSGCAHYPFNAPLAAVDPRAGYRFETAASPTNSDSLLLMLAFSGGGIRASALSYGVLEELANTQIGSRGSYHRLLDEVDLITSVSGGSFTAACYGLWGDRIFSDFESQFLKKHVQTALVLRALYPVNCIRLVSTKFNSSDLAAEYYDRLLFKGATFEDLARRSGRPFIAINATDVALSSRFEFTQDQFDLLGSDLAQFPIARAVAASAAFPVWLSPIVLKNYSAENSVTEPEWIRSVLSDPASSSRLRNTALQSRSYLEFDRRRFIHLLDGGVSDNLGLRGSLDRAIAHEGPTGLSPAAALKNAHRLAVIVVDAHIERDYGWDYRERSPGFKEVLGSIGSGAISRYSFETIELFKETSARLAREQNELRSAGVSTNAPLSTYIIELHFNQLANDDDRRFFNSVPTRLQLPGETVDRLRRIARDQLAENPEFRRLLRDLSRPTPIGQGA